PALVVLLAQVLDGDPVRAVARGVPNDRADVIPLGLGVADAFGRLVPADELALLVADLHLKRRDRVVVAQDDHTGPLAAPELHQLAAFELGVVPQGPAPAAGGPLARGGALAEGQARRGADLDIIAGRPSDGARVQAAAYRRRHQEEHKRPRHPRSSAKPAVRYL